MRLERRRAVAATPGLESWPGDFPAPDSGALALSWSREAWSMGRRGQRPEIRDQKVGRRRLGWRCAFCHLTSVLCHLLFACLGLGAGAAFERLGPLGCTGCPASTCGLSTWWSTTALDETWSGGGFPA
jgi:hypothetical protein